MKKLTKRTAPAIDPERPKGVVATHTNSSRGMERAGAPLSHTHQDGMPPEAGRAVDDAAGVTGSLLVQTIAVPGTVREPGRD